MPSTIQHFRIHFVPEVVDELLPVGQQRERSGIVKSCDNAIEDGAQRDEISLGRLALSWLLRRNPSQRQGFCQGV